MERGLTQLALLTSAPAVGSWGRKKGYSKKAYRPSREGHIYPVAAVAPRHLLGRKETRRPTPAPLDAPVLDGVQLKNIQNLGVNPFNSRPTSSAVNRDMVNPSERLAPPQLAPPRTTTPAASQKVSEWISRSRSAGVASRARHYEDEDARSAHSRGSGYSYSSGTSFQSYSGNAFPDLGYWPDVQNLSRTHTGIVLCSALVQRPGVPHILTRSVQTVQKGHAHAEARAPMLRALAWAHQSRATRTHA